MRLSKFLAILMLLCAAVATSHAAVTQFRQQGSKLVGTGAVGMARQGESVAVSADGNTAIVGGSGDNGGAGAAWVFTRSGGVWTQQGGKLNGTGAVGLANQGGSVALSADGNTAAVGGPSDNSAVGATWVFTRSGGVWTQQGTKVVGSGAVSPARQGYSVALSADGNTVMVGGPSDADFRLEYKGATWVFTRSGGVWTQQGPKLVSIPLPAGSVQQGYRVALSADGNTGAVGAPKYSDAYSGLGGGVFIFARSGDVWAQQGAPLVGTGQVGVTDEGRSVAISADGDTVLAGGPFDNTAEGATWIFTRTGGIWTQQGPKVVGAGAMGFALFGQSVALSADGNTAITGGDFDNGGTGAMWVFARSGGIWAQQGGKLVGTGAVGNAQQGHSVALSADTTTAIVGGLLDDGQIGAAWVYAAVQELPAVASVPTVGPTSILALCALLAAMGLLAVRHRSAR
ncbi:MAG: hypothetical protein ABI569_06420 [Casimicrobiaceae bacterium]